MATVDPPIQPRLRAPYLDDDDLTPVPSPEGKLTEEEFFEWCRGFDKIRAEWVDGETIVMSPVNWSHSELAGFLTAVLRPFVRRHDLGKVGAEYGCRLLARGRRMLRAPDVLFIAKANLDRVGPTSMNGAPDLAVEIVSPDSSSRDYREKFLDYQSAGVREYWIIDPLSQKIEMSSLDDQSGEFRPIALTDGRLHSVVLPGFFLRPEWLWSDPMPAEDDVLRQMSVLRPNEGVS
jgi:Uma2 family endonuclease